MVKVDQIDQRLTVNVDRLSLTVDLILGAHFKKIVN